MKFEGKIVNILQKKEMEMLLKLKSILEANDIPFCLAWGSLLGCARHGGFIPWDDDIDIHIDGKYYKKLKKVFSEQDTGDLVLQDGLSTPNYPFCFPKIVDKKSLLVEKELEHLDYKCGIYIDVFLIFGVPDRKIIRFFAKFFRYLKYAVLRARYNSRGLLHFLSLFFSTKRIHKTLYRIYCKGIGNSKFCCEPTTFDKKVYIDSNIFKNFKYKEFEDNLMPVPYDFDSYLRHFYGNYLELPPIENRVSNHHISRLIIDGEEII